MSGLASASGAQPSDHSTSIVGATSTSWLTWQLTVSSTPAPLATEWAASTVYSDGQVVKHKGRFYRCTTSGTSGSSGPSGVGDDIEDGSAVWRGVAEFANGIKIINIAATGGQTVYWSDDSVSSSVGDAILAGGGYVTLSVADPTLIYVVTATSTATICVAGLC